eukprot:1185307-Prorocentrum_minimum.AAC.2
MLRIIHSCLKGDRVGQEVSHLVNCNYGPRIKVYSTPRGYMVCLIAPVTNDSAARDRGMCTVILIRCTRERGTCLSQPVSRSLRLSAHPQRLRLCLASLEYNMFCRN